MNIKPFLTCSAFAILFFSCKKDMPGDIVSTNNLSNYSTDGLLSVQVSIAGSSTPSTFLANTPDKAVSFTSYDLIAGSKKIYTDYFHVAAPYPTVFAMFQGPNTEDELTAFQVPSQIFPGKSLNIATSIVYNNVDSLTSPTEVTCTLKDIVYHTEDYTSHTLVVDSSSGSSFAVCLVNNIAHMSFQSPANYKVQSDGFVEMARVKLTGDTSWTLKSLPVNFFFTDGSSGTFPSKLIVKNKGRKIATAAVTSGHSTTLQFANGVKHVPGQTETLTILGYNLTVDLPSYFVTEMGDLDGLGWYDGVGGFIPGALNAKYYKEVTGSASLYNH